MNFQGTQVLNQPQQRVWDALLDPEVLRQSIAGCDKFERTSETDYASSVKVSIGPVSARFSSTMSLLDMAPPTACTLRFSGQGGVAGFGKGEARVALTAVSATETRLDWQADAQVGGKLAQLGARLIEGSVRKMSEDFFQRFAAQLASTPAEAAPASSPATPPRPAVPDSLWVAALLGGGALLIWWFAR
ncbi:CoxG family protein [Hydrogenophaga sp. OTU3427]|uniref:CoxG family protein n=1 Tax=Hydrogenophaga sp. OTU3427 TaxID=3043856 RepID=UPI00313C0D40